MALRKHMTQGDQLKIMKLLRSGVTSMEEIQSVVFIHESCIRAVAKKFSNQQKSEKSGKLNPAQELMKVKAEVEAVHFDENSTPAEKSAATKLLKKAQAEFDAAGETVDPLS